MASDRNRGVCHFAARGQIIMGCENEIARTAPGCYCDEHNIGRKCLYRKQDSRLCHYGSSKLVSREKRWQRRSGLSRLRCDRKGATRLQDRNFHFGNPVRADLGDWLAAYLHRDPTTDISEITSAPMTMMAHRRSYGRVF